MCLYKASALSDHGVMFFQVASMGSPGIIQLAKNELDGEESTVVVGSNESFLSRVYH